MKAGMRLQAVVTSRAEERFCGKRPLPEVSARSQIKTERKAECIMYNSKIYSHGYIGTYHSEESRGVYHFTFNEKNGQMTEPELFYETENAKWVTKRRLACFFHEKGRARRHLFFETQGWKG